MSGTFELNPTFSFTLLGTFAIFAWMRPSRSSWFAVLIITLGLRLARIRLIGGLGTYFGVWWIGWGAFLGLASLIVLAAQVGRPGDRMSDSDRKLRRRTFYAAAVFPVCSLLNNCTVPLSNWVRPRAYDAFLLAFDGSLGFQPSFVAGRLLPWGSNAWGFTTIVYYAMPLAASILYASYLGGIRAGKRQPVAILALLLCLMAAGIVLYVIYPAVGPKHAFGELYPQNPPRVAQILLQPMAVPDDPRNCMPSLHLAGALAIFWNAYLWPRWGRLLAGVFLWATVFATLALGEHYLVDLVVAVPFTLIFQAAWTWAVPLTHSVRCKSLVVGIMLTLAWLVLLRYGLRLFLISPLIPWASMILSVAWCLVLQNKLRTASRFHAS